MNSSLEYHPIIIGVQTKGNETGRRKLQGGKLAWGGGFQKVTEAAKGSLSAVGNRAKSAKAEGSLTATHTGGAGTKVGLSDPVVPRGRADRKSTRLNSSHANISYAVFCLKKKKPASPNGPQLFVG